MKKLGSILLCATLVATPVLSVNQKDVSAKPKTVTVKANGKDKKDDTKAIQSAMDKVKSGGTVKIPKGTYYVKCLNLKKNMKLQLDKKTVLKRTKGKHMERWSFITCEPKKKKYSGFSKITISGGTLDGGIHSDNKKNSYKAIYLDHGQNLTIKNMTIKNFSGLHEIEVAAVKNVTIDHMTFKNHYLYDDSKNHFYKGEKWSVYTCEAFQFDSAFKGLATVVPADGTVCQNVRITNCKFDHVMSGLGTHHNEKKYFNAMHKNIYVANNTFKNIRGDAIHLNNVNGVTCKNNKCLTGGCIFETYYHSYNVKDSNNVSKKFLTGVQAVQGTTGTFDHNQYLATPNVKSHPHTTPTAFYATGAKIAVTNSTIVGRPHSVINIEKSKNFQLKNCYLDGVANHSGFGLLAKDDTNSVIDGNTFKGKTNFGIMGQGGSYKVSNNKFIGWRPHFEGGSKYTDVNNTITY